MAGNVLLVPFFVKKAIIYLFGPSDTLLGV